MIHLVPCNSGMPKQEVEARLSSGWVLAGRQAISVKQDLILPGMTDNPSRVIDADVWVLPEATMPQLAVVLGVLSVSEEVGESDGLDKLAQVLFNTSVASLREMIEAQEEQDAA